MHQYEPPSSILSFSDFGAILMTDSPVEKEVGDASAKALGHNLEWFETRSHFSRQVASTRQSTSLSKVMIWTSAILRQQPFARYVFTSSPSVAASVSTRNAPSYTPEYTLFIPTLLPVISSGANRKRKWKCQHGHQLASEAGLGCRQYSSSAPRW